MNEKENYREIFFTGGIVSTWYEDGQFYYELIDPSKSKDEDNYYRRKNRWTNNNIHGVTD